MWISVKTELYNKIFYSACTGMVLDINGLLRTCFRSKMTMSAWFWQLHGHLNK